MQFDLFTPSARYQENVKRAVVLSHGRLPTTDIYLAERLASLPGLSTIYVDTLSQRPGSHEFDQGDFVIIVRHAPLPWLKVLAANRARLAGVVLLLDDDSPAVLESSELPLMYALKTALRYVRGQRLLARLCSEVWVSTPYLQSKYAHANPRLLSPLYLAAPSPNLKQVVTYFYHGTASHRLEHAFLVNVVSKVQARIAHAHFEVMGTSRTKRLFKGIPRVRVLHPMAWPDFLAYTAGVRHAVGLAPMLDSHFNQARSHVKLYDITRCGAAGIYSDVPVYRDNVQDGVSGILCPNDENAWVEAICRLLTDEPARAEITAHAQAWCEQHARDPGFTLLRA